MSLVEWREGDDAGIVVVPRVRAAPHAHVELHPPVASGHRLPRAPAMRVVVISPVRIYGEVLALLLDRSDATEVVGIADAVAPAVAVLAATRPELALVDAPLLRRQGLLDRIRVGHPPVRIVAFGVRDDVADIAACARAGVAGYVSHDAGAAELLDVLDAVGRGTLSCTPTLTATLLRRATELGSEVTSLPVSSAGLRGVLAHPAPERILSERELEILSLVGDGLMNKQIARSLGIALSTVKNHVHHILQKEAVASRRDLVRLCRDEVGTPGSPARRLDRARIS